MCSAPTPQLPGSRPVGTKPGSMLPVEFLKGRRFLHPTDEVLSVGTPLPAGRGNFADAASGDSVSGFGLAPDCLVSGAWDTHLGSSCNNDLTGNQCP